MIVDYILQPLRDPNLKQTQVEVVENTEQLGDLSVEKGDLGAEKDFIAEENDVNYEEEVKHCELENDVRVDEEVDEHCEPENDVRVDEEEQGVADESRKTSVHQDVDITNIGDVITPEWDRNFLNDTARIEEDVQSNDDGKVLQLWVGQRWEDIKSCMDHLREYAIERKFAIILPKNNSDKIKTVCKNLN
ncbi:hypothetical protein FRX31_014383, partial [Thalictrum thalictroides]